MHHMRHCPFDTAAYIVGGCLAGRVAHFRNANEWNRMLGWAEGARVAGTVKDTDTKKPLK